MKREVELDKTARQEQERAVKAARRRLHEVFAREIAKMPGANRQAGLKQHPRYSFIQQLFESFGSVEPELVDLYFARYENRAQVALVTRRVELGVEELISGISKSPGEP